MTPAVRQRVGISDVERATGMSRVTIWRWLKRGAFPEPGYIAGRRFWFLDEIEAWAARESSKPADPRRLANLQHVSG